MKTLLKVQIHGLYVQMVKMIFCKQAHQVLSKIHFTWEKKICIFKLLGNFLIVYVYKKNFFFGNS